MPCLQKRTALRLLVSLLLLCAALPALAQFSSSVQGNVADPSSASVPNAIITLTNTETKVAQSGKSDAAGVYRFVSLAPGPYDITVTAQGFSTTTNHFVLQTAQNLDVPLKLAVGNVATTVQVSTQAPLLDTSDSRNQFTISSEDLEELPLPNRNPTGLIGITPGVVNGLGAQGNINYSPENFIDASANGRGENGNVYIVDGLDATSNIRPGVLNLTPNGDIVAEESVQVNTYDVGYARGGGIQTNITTKSGTQKFHGYASDLFTYQNWNSRGEFGPTHAAVPNLPPEHTNNSSFGVGGPILPKQKLFFFAFLQPYHNEGSNYGNTYYEDPAFVAFANQVQPNNPETALFSKYPIKNVVFSGVNSTASQLLGSQNIAGNSGCGTPSTDNIPCGTPVVDVGEFNNVGYNHSKQYGLRIDKYFSKDRLYGNFIRNTETTLGSNPRPAFNTTSQYFGFSIQVNETHTFNANTLNEVTFASNRIEGIAPNSGTFDVPIVNVTGIDGFGDGFADGDYIQVGYHWRDVFTHIVGSHDLQFGYDGWHGQDHAVFQGAYAQPTFSFTNVIDLINDNPYTEGGLSYNITTGQPEPGNYNDTVTTFGFFAQDTWKATKHLTVTYGLRYDNFGNPSPALATTIASPFVLGSGSTLNEQVANGSIRIQKQTLNHDLNWNFNPRIGAAWDPTGSGKWKISGGFGIYDDQILLGNIADPIKGNPPNWTLPTFYNNGSTAAPIFSYGTQNTYPFGFVYPKFGGEPLDAKGGLVGSEIAVANVAVDAHTPKSYNWSATLEHALNQHLVAEVFYSGSHSGGILMGGGGQGANQFGYDLNHYQGDLTQHINCASSGRCTGTYTGLNTSFGAIALAYNVARANYEGFVAALKGRLGDHTFVTASYTRSISKDDESIFAPDFDQNRFYGNSPYDIPNRFSLGANYDFPGIDLSNAFVKRLTGGWNLGGVVTLQSGAPVVITTGNPFDAQLVNPALTATVSNLAYRPDSGDFDANGYNYDFPNVDPRYRIHTSRAAYKAGVFPSCIATTGSNLNNCGPFTFPAFGQQGNETVNAQFRNPGYADTDLTLKKNTSIIEGVNLELFVEGINAFNRVNLSGIDANGADSTFGRVTANGQVRYLLIGATARF